MVTAAGMRTLAMRAAGEEAILRGVQFALYRAGITRCGPERRRERRHPFPYPVRLTPVGLTGELPHESITVVGKHLSNHGLDFYCQHPLPYRRVVATFGHDTPTRVQILMDLSWCRFSQHGWYENGGRFLSAVNVPNQLVTPPPSP